MPQYVSVYLGGDQQSSPEVGGSLEVSELIEMSSVMLTEVLT